MSYIRDTHADRLLGYDGHNVDVILRLLRHETTSIAAGGNSTSSLTPLNGTMHSDPHHRTASDRHRDVTDPKLKRSRDVRMNHTGLDAVVGDHAVDDHAHNDLHDVAHGLHFASIAMLGLLVLEVLLVKL